jgi:hypothetical protein
MVWIGSVLLLVAVIILHRLYQLYRVQLIQLVAHCIAAHPKFLLQTTEVYGVQRIQEQPRHQLRADFAFEIRF